MPQPGLVDALVDLGFSLNESRAYCALLRQHPATGYEVAARANIPRSAVYGTLRRLVATGAARSIAGTPERFAPAPADQLLTLLRKRFDGSASAFEQAARTLDLRTEEPDAFSVHGYRRVLEEAERLIRDAHRQLVISAWPREIQTIAAELHAAAERGVFLVIFSHAALPSLPGEIFSYGLAEAALERFWKHRLIVVADDIRTLIAAAENTDQDHGVLSQMAPIAEVATSQIALDITLLSQRIHHDASSALSRMLGHRVGSLDTLLRESAEAEAPARRRRSR